MYLKRNNKGIPIRNGNSDQEKKYEMQKELDETKQKLNTHQLLCCGCIH